MKPTFPPACGPLAWVVLVATAAADERLRLHVVDDASGAPLPCRVTLVDREGRSHPFTAARAGAAVGYDVVNWVNPRSVERHTTLAEFPAEAALPPGDYELVVERGQAWLPARRRVTVAAGGLAVEVRLRRLADPTAAGWYAGDTHLHRTIDDLRTVVLAEDLNVAFPLTYWVTTSDAAPAAGDKNQATIPPPEPIVVDATHLIWPRNTEYEIFAVGGRRHTLGALFVLGHRQPIGLTVPPWKPLVEAVRAAEPQAAFDTDKLDWPFAMLLPAIVPGALVELSNNHLWRTEFAFRDWSSRAPAFLRPPFGGRQGGERAWLDYTLGMYYTLLDCGLRLPPSAGTASGVHPVPAGFGRVYVRCRDGLDIGAWLAGLRAGRSFVSTGPLLEVAVEGRDPGHVFAGTAAAGLTLDVTGTIVSQEPLSYAEVVVNGLPERLLEPGNEPLPGGGFRTRVATTVRIERSGWLAVRAFEQRPAARVRFAHTAPWYVEIDGRPVGVPADRKAYLVGRMRDEIDRSKDVLPAAALAEYRDALAFYERLPDRDDAAEVARSARPLGAGVDRAAWLDNMLVEHRFSPTEVRRATGLAAAEATAEWQGRQAAAMVDQAAAIRVLPYPGGRHPRRGFLEGAIDPQRETKVSIFTPWREGGYVVVDVPEAIFSNLGLLYLAHTHLPTIWDDRGERLPPLEWQVTDETLTCQRRLPNGILFTSHVARRPAGDGGIGMSLSLTNGTAAPLTGLRVQVCTMLSAAEGFQHQLRLEEVLSPPFAAVRAVDHDRWIVTAWEPCHRVWTKAPVPCVHADPVFPDCPPGRTVTVRGRLWFHEGPGIEAFIAARTIAAP